MALEIYPFTNAAQLLTAHYRVPEDAHTSLKSIQEILNERALPKSVVLVTGGAGFLGSHFIAYLLDRYHNYEVINYDKLTYAGNLDNLRAVEKNPRYTFIQADIADRDTLEKVVRQYNIRLIVNFAAETHVDRSIKSATAFVRTNVEGVHHLLEIATKEGIRLVHISTDEVFGSTLEGAFHELSPFQPNSPYSAAKAGGDLLCRAYAETHKTDVVVTHSCNVFGPYQHPEKFIPLFVTNLIEEKRVPLYGDGLHRREWIFVDDHSRAVDIILHKGEAGGVYNIGGENEKMNIEIARDLLSAFEKDDSWIEYIEDRKGHDRRYAIDAAKLKNIGWMPVYKFDDALKRTITWYQKNDWWWKPLLKKEYQKYDDRHKPDRWFPPVAQTADLPPELEHRRTRMKALITAGGHGTRLRPITFTRNKHLIPLANKPMLEHAIEKVVDAGITNIGISINTGDTMLPKLVGDGSRFGARITYIEQTGGPLGLAHVVKNARDFLGEDDFLFYLGDNIIATDLREFIDWFYENRLNCFLALAHVKDPQRFGVPVIENDRIVRIEEKPEHPASDFAVAGIYIYDRNIHHATEHLKPSARGEYEISDAHTVLIEKGYKVGFREITGWWKDTGKPEDLLEGNRLLLDEIRGAIKGTVDTEAVLEGHVVIEAGAHIQGQSFIRGPAIIGAGTRIINSYIGPYTAIGKEVIVQNAEVEHSLILDRALVDARRRIVDSIVGYNAKITAATQTLPSGHKLILGDHSHMEL